MLSVADWVLRLRLDMPTGAGVDAAEPDGDQEAVTRANELMRRRAAGGATRKDAVARVSGYFERNATARLALAYYYQEFILGLSTPQTVPMLNVVIALDLSGEGGSLITRSCFRDSSGPNAVTRRDLTGFLLANGLLTSAHLNEARLLAEQNERDGVCETARRRLCYRPKGK